VKPRQPDSCLRASVVVWHVPGMGSRVGKMGRVGFGVPYWGGLAALVFLGAVLIPQSFAVGANPSSKVCAEAPQISLGECPAWDQEMALQRKVAVEALERRVGREWPSADAAAGDRWERVAASIEGWVESLKTNPGQVTEKLVAASQRAQKECQAAFRRLEERLEIAGPSAEGWKEYIDYPRLKGIMEKREPWSADFLGRIYQRLAAGHPGLELRCFADLRESLRSYLLRERSLGDEQTTPRVLEVGQQLARAVRDCAVNPSPEKLIEIYQTFSWLQILGFDGVWARELTHAFGGPNLQVRISDRLVQAGVDRPVEDTGPFEDVILGTYLVGTSRTRGHLKAVLVPSDRAGLVGLVLEGTIHTEARGFNGPVQVITQGQTAITAEKLLALGRKELISFPAYSEACTNSEICDLWATRGGALVEAIAWRRAWSQKPLADAIAAEHAETRMNRRLDEEVGTRLADANRRFSQRLSDSLQERGLYPQVIAWRTTTSFVEGLGWQKGRGGLGSPSMPPQAFSEHDLLVGIHETAINFALAETFGGMILGEAELRQWAEEVWGRVPSWMEVEDPAEPWTIVLAPERPIEVAFRGDLLSITIRGQAYRKGERSFPGMDVTAIYRLEDSAEGRVAVRQGDLQIYPPGFKEEERKLTAREQVLRTLLARRFAKVFPERWVGPRIEWSRKDTDTEAPIVLRTAGWTTIEGWLLIGWSLSN
jgi:hypothetical protein